MMRHHLMVAGGFMSTGLKPVNLKDRTKSVSFAHGKLDNAIYFVRLRWNFHNHPTRALSKLDRRSIDHGMRSDNLADDRGERQQRGLRAKLAFAGEHHR